MSHLKILQVCVILFYKWLFCEQLKFETDMNTVKLIGTIFLGLVRCSTTKHSVFYTSRIKLTLFDII